MYEQKSDYPGWTIGVDHLFVIRQHVETNNQFRKRSRTDPHFCGASQINTYLVFPASISWASIPLLMGLRWLAVVVAIASTTLFYWTLSSLGKNLTDTVVTRNDAVLATDGPYRWVRHPFYVSAALLMASVTVLTANWLIGISSLLVLMLLAIRTPKEEQMLIQRFGDDYRRYIETTGKFFPRFWC